ncbi:MAG: pseudouridine synthase [Patescibacteria group bacterium]
MVQMRLQKYLSQCGIASRRQAEEYILEGLVRVNGRVVDKMGVKIDPDQDEVRFRKKIINAQKKVYYLLHKPAGYVATRRDNNAPKKVIDLVPAVPPVYPVGRLDKNTEGLILLTNDGELTNYLIHPKHHVEKEYFVISEPRFDDFQLDKAIKKLAKGVLITGYLTKPALVTKVKQDRTKITFNITIREGKHHQIYRMCHNVGLKVTKLVRVRFGNLKLGNMKKGEYKIINKSEITTKK